MADNSRDEETLSNGSPAKYDQDPRSPESGSSVALQAQDSSYDSLLHSDKCSSTGYDRFDDQLRRGTRRSGKQETAKLQSENAVAEALAGSRASSGHWNGYGMRWPVNELLRLPQTVCRLVASGLTACEIGMVTETVLYGRDVFMDGKVTALIDIQATYVEITAAVIQYYQDTLGQEALPTLHDVRPGNSTLRPGRRALVSQDRAGKGADWPGACLFSSREACSSSDQQTHYMPAGNDNNGKRLSDQQPVSQDVLSLASKNPVAGHLTLPIISPRPRRVAPVARFLRKSHDMQDWEEQDLPGQEDAALAAAIVERQDIAMASLPSAFLSAPEWPGDIEDESLCQAEFDRFAFPPPKMQGRLESVEDWAYYGLPTGQVDDNDADQPLALSTETLSSTNAQE